MKKKDITQYTDADRIESLNFLAQVGPLSQKQFTEIALITASAKGTYDLNARKFGKIKAYRLAILEYEKRYQEWKTEADKEAHIPCKKGCSFCCRIETSSWKTEVLSILDNCKQKGISIDKNYLRSQQKVGRHNIMFSVEFGACVFLKNGECSIYEFRPACCRSYFVAGEAEKCDTLKYPHYTQAIPRDLRADMRMAAIMDTGKEHGWLVDLLLKNMK